MKNLFNNIFRTEGGEKKVEYIELIYDLIFVYIIGRNNLLLEHVESGFVDGMTYLTYFLCTLIVIQIWYFTTLFINRYGTNGLIEHALMFINMYLLYYMGNGTRSDWNTSEYFLEYNIAWGLILLNIGVQYLIKLKEINKNAPWESVHVKRNAQVILIEGAAVFALIPLYFVTGIALTPLAVLVGMVAAGFMPQFHALKAVDFEHLTERVMLYVVFTFGEMIIAVSEYFEGEFTLSTLYFSLMAFLIVVALFSSYGFFYDHIVDREQTTRGTLYMMVHIFLILALNNITNALIFMHEAEIDAIPKNVFMIASLCLYYVCLFLNAGSAKRSPKGDRKFFAALFASLLVFVLLMFIFYRNSYVSILVTVAFVYAVLFIMIFFWNKVTDKASEND